MRIQIQSIIIDYIFLCEPSDTCIIISCTQIVKTCQFILNLCIIPYTVRDVIQPDIFISKYIIPCWIFFFIQFVKEHSTNRKSYAFNRSLHIYNGFCGGYGACLLFPFIPKLPIAVTLCEGHSILGGKLDLFIVFR